MRDSLTKKSLTSTLSLRYRRKCKLIAESNNVWIKAYLLGYCSGNVINRVLDTLQLYFQVEGEE